MEYCLGNRSVAWQGALCPVLGVVENEEVVRLDMWYETFVVELGTKEIFVDVYGAKGKEPTFKVEAGTDWEGFPVPLSKQEQDAAINWVRKNYGI